MEKIIQQFRKVFWLPKSQIKLLEKERIKLKMRNDSEVMRHIINTWFKK